MSCLAEDAIGKNVGNPLEHVYGGVIPGGEKYIEKTLDRLKGQDISRKMDISCREAWSSELSHIDVNCIIDQVCKYFRTSKDDILNRKGEKRDVAIYLVKRYTNLSNRQIGEIFGSLSYSAVSKVYKRFMQKMAKDMSLMNKVETLKTYLSNVKG
ncbi:MAG: helix-turn-helix domain-containing protein [bacterium]